MLKLNSLIFFCVLSFFLTVSKAFGSEGSAFSFSPNSSRHISQPDLKSIVFGSEVLGILVPKSVSTRCECLLIWNGVRWNEDEYYLTFGETVLQSKGFYRPYNHSPLAYSIDLNKEDWSKVKKSHQFFKSFNSKQLSGFSVVQLDSPHAPFVYLEMSLNGKLEVFRLETPQDLTPHIEAWLKKASLSNKENQVKLSLTYDLYQTGTGQESTLFTVHYQFKDERWHTLQSN